MVISGAKILDQSGERLLEDKDLLIADGKIEGIGSSGELQIPRAATRVDATGLTLVPGLMDLHTHLLIGALTEDGATDRELFEAYTKQVVQESIPRRTIRAVVAARVTLEAGFTTVRDVCTEGAQYADVALRDSIREGIIPGPRIFASTRGIAATGCYMPLGFDRRFEVTQSAQVADGEDQIRQAVREQVARGADLIKVFADFPRSGWRMTPCFTQDELNALVDEARTAGVSVAAHAMTDEGIRRCVLAGVRTIEHGTFASAESLRLMQDHGVALCPTLMAGTREEGMTLIQRARDADVTIVCGSDAGEYPHGQNARELGLLVEYGLSPAEALRAATVSAAEVLELSDRLGRIAPGYIADIVAVRGNPLKDISVLRKPIVVIKDGKVHLDRS
jgi:imidazolonepropionase-like amidohydrolase